MANVTESHSSVMSASKVCTQCGVEKPLSEFPPHNRRPDGTQSYCRECGRKTSAERRKWPETQEYHRRQHKAWAEAERRLREKHRREFDRYYAEERRKVGL